MKVKRQDEIKETPIKMEWGSIKFNGGFYTTLKIEVYDYKKNKDVTVSCSTQDLEKQLQKFYFAPDGSVPKQQKEKAIEIYDSYTVFLPVGSFNKKMRPKALKTLIEKNLYPAY